jgi:hypothetical protein
MATNIDDPFAVPAGDPFAALSGGFDIPSVDDPFSVDGDEGKQAWEAISQPLDGEEPEETAARVLGAVEAAFKDRASAETKRMADAVDSNFWLCVAFDTRSQKDEFLEAIKAIPERDGDKYVYGPAFAKLCGIDLAPSGLRRNISDKLDKRYGELARDLGEVKASVETQHQEK